MSGKFKLLNMMYALWKQYNKWETHLCFEIHMKIEETILEESGCLVMGRFDGDSSKWFTIKAILSIYMTEHAHVDIRRCTGSHVNMTIEISCRQVKYSSSHWWLPYYRVVQATYVSSIFPIPNYDKPMNEPRHLHLWSPISKKRLGCSRYKRV